MQSGFILTHFFYCPSAVVKGNNLPIDIVTSTFFRNNFIQIVTVLILCLFAKQYNVLMFCFLKNLLTFEWIDIVRLLTFEWINIVRLHPESIFFRSINCLFFPFILKISPWNSIKIKISSYQLQNLIPGKNLELITREFYSE